MKVDLAVPLYSVIALLCTCLPVTRCQTPVNCRWGPYGEWSECDGCSQTKVRTRRVQVYAQYNGVPCPGAATESVPCVAAKACPLDSGCGERFRCTSGRCISPSLVCNGDQDCEDGRDETSCNVDTSHHVCDMDQTPPNSDFTGRGYDVLTGKLKLGVIDTLRFGGQCRKVFSGDHRVFFRLPQSILRYNFEVQVNNEESDETYDSSWSYMQHIQSDALFIHDRRTFHKELSETKAHKLLILKNRVQLAQFQNSAPQYLPLTEGFWRALGALPLTYDYSAYRQLLRAYGTHYMSEGSLGGEYRALLEFDRDAMKQSSTTDTEYQRCWRKVKRRIFYKKIKTTCEKLTQALKSSSGHDLTHLSVKTNTIGGDPAFLAALGVLDLENPEANGDSYATWASSVKDFPDVVDQKLRPVYELVKEVRCAGLKKMHLKRALEELLAEEHPCHCRPCGNNGQPLLTGTQCSCVCRPGSSGLACERGTVTGEPPGVIHGSWSCWSSWSSCSGGQRSRARSCNNPAPSRGGQHCIGLENESSPCEEPDMHYLQMMEPQCFGLAVAPPKTCGAPPALRNGYVVNPRDFYPVGKRIEYRCIDGHYLSGDAVAECNDSQKWTTGQMVCKSATCGVPPLSSDVTFAPTKAAYQIGDRVTLSCPAGGALQGHVTESICNPSLQWSPALEEARCMQVPKVATTTTTTPPALNCKPWQRAGKAQCVCKMPFQCEPSVKLCARLGSSTRLLGACQLGALQCLGRSFTLAKDTDCDWPTETFTSCQNCNPGEKCNESATNCVCRDPAECPGDPAQMCVTPGDGSVAVTMTGCEVGARRCAGEKVTVVSLEACQS